MKLTRLIFCFIILFFLVQSVFSQSSNIRAQARYYSAKEAYEIKNFSEAVKLTIESKELLGGSNYLLQYIHIMSAYRSNDFEEAQKEMKRYFDLIDKKEEIISFSRNVDELTNDETTELVKVMDKIDRGVEQNFLDREHQSEMTLDTKWGNKMLYKGTVQNQMPNGKGVAKYNTGWTYEGYFINGECSGKGILFKDDLKYEGDWKNNVLSGFAKIRSRSKSDYNLISIVEGNFMNGSLEGSGSIKKYKNQVFQRSFIGEFSDGRLIKGKFNDPVNDYFLDGTYRYNLGNLEFMGRIKVNELSGRYDYYRKLPWSWSEWRQWVDYMDKN